MTQNAAKINRLEIRRGWTNRKIPLVNNKMKVGGGETEQSSAKFDVAGEGKRAP